LKRLSCEKGGGDGEMKEGQDKEEKGEGGKKGEERRRAGED
jgi:hypothetical protein